MDVVEFVELIERWDRLILALARHEGDELPWPVRTTGTVLREGASGDAVRGLEARLGTGLPPSYRLFLQRSDGAWAQLGWGLRGHRREPEGDGLDGLGMLDRSRVGWFRDRDPSYLDIWAFGGGGPMRETPTTNPAFTRRVPERVYLDHERESDFGLKDGHLLYALQVSSDVDGYTVLLNPLVVDRQGEWEAWDLGTEGATRHRSFAHLLAADVRRLERWLSRSPRGVDVVAKEGVARDRHASPDERARAIHLLAYANAAGRILDLLLEECTNSTADVSILRAALSALSTVDDERARSVVISAAKDARMTIRAAVVAPLAANSDPAARRAAIDLLANPAEDDIVIHNVYAAGADAVYEAWSRTGHPRLLRQLAYCQDRRAAAPLAAAILDRSIDREQRTELIRYAWWPRDTSVVPALIAAADEPDAPLEAIGDALLHLGAVEEAVPLLTRVPPQDGFGQLPGVLSRLNHPVATAALIRLCRTDPTPPALRALGWCEGDPAVDALVAASANEELRFAAIDGLERMRDQAAADALTAMVERGDIAAARALARRRDLRVRTFLLGLLTSDDAGLVFEAVDGLRDLRDPSTAGRLLELVRTHHDPDVVACAAHALVSMRSPLVDEALMNLAQGPDDDLRRLAAIWSEPAA